jgi:homocysteine S-methyltransferase
VVNQTVPFKDPIAAFLAVQPLVVLDGALATELERRGADLNDPLWSARLLIDRPELIHAVHRDYFRAGADVATSATYQATFEGFARCGIEPDGAALLMRNAVSLAISARDEFWSAESQGPGHEWPGHERPGHERPDRVVSGRLRPLVAASVGPYGAALADGSEYRGNYGLSESQLRDFHRPRIRVLADSGADLLACETIPSLREAIAIVSVLEEFPATAAWLSFSCRDGAHTCEGQEIGDCVAELAEHAQIAAVGVNCTAPLHVSSLLQRMRERTNKPLLAYPNSGEVYDASNKHWHGPAVAIPFAELARGWYRDGARLIGGCCRTRPADIEAIRAWALDVKTPAS